MQHPFSNLSQQHPTSRNTVAKRTHGFMFLEISEPPHEVTKLEILWVDEKKLVQRTIDHYQPQTIYVQDSEIKPS